MAADRRFDMRNGKISVAALDIFFAVLIVVAVIGVAARYLLTEENGILANTPEYQEAALSVLVTDIEGTSAEHFVEGGKFTLTDEKYQGVIIADFIVTPAEYYEENEAGELVIAYHDEENGNIDCRGAVKVNGYYRDGVYYIDGETIVTSGMTVTLTNGKISVSALITDISPIS